MKKIAMMMVMVIGFSSGAFAKTALPQLAASANGVVVPVPEVLQAQIVSPERVSAKNINLRTRRYISNSGYSQKEAAKELNSLVSRLQNAGIEVLNTTIFNSSTESLWYFTVEFKSQWLIKTQNRTYYENSRYAMERYLNEKAMWESRSDLVMLEVVTYPDYDGEYPTLVELYYLPLVKGAAIFPDPD